MFVFSEISRGEMDDFSKNHIYGNIHQTSMWADFQSGSEGRGRAIICGVKGGKKVVAGAVVVKQFLPFGLCWYFVPRGPLADSKEVFDILMEGILKIGKKDNCVFVRIEPPSLHGEVKFFDEWGRKAHAHYYPEHSLIVDLAGSEEEILKQMKPKGRYNIKIAEKSGVTVRISDKVSDFYKIFKETTERDKFSGHELKYYEKMFEALEESVKLYLAEVGGKVVAGIIVTYYRRGLQSQAPFALKNTAIYYFGASANEYRNCMAPYLLQWTAMRDAKKAGMKFYDLFGIAPEGDTNHPWAGITDFKMKFGGKRVAYAEAREKEISWFWYWVMRGRKRV
ncbi:MAG: pentaglycine interpeptide bridge formation protein [Candidatus Peregrinibacteria bacterium GW2011_GWF2_43_17]|nr:MAG: pentaglycine interpeptide bridge formation protein [Candidatus Peregrinibacteria bacterium GW2011_GWF2_43_17]KKT19186.1 MAG: Pentaglycine interpeptide bridge formation protein [Candidatus Peregrinibacteria bacterium GW2011_GWA2_43_8]HAU39593.1 hypothetical protein [Candidatus Peregrinibacteria bacterium]